MIEAALDTSHGISLALSDNQRIVCRAEASFASRASEAALVPWIQQQVDALGLRVDEITRWTVGTGPGSFTGLRCGIAFVRGVCLQSAAACRGLPSSLAVASQAVAEDSGAAEVVVLNDARRGQIIVSRYRHGQGILRPLGEPCVMEPEELAESLHDGILLTSIHQKEIEELLPAECREATLFFDYLDASRLLAPPGSAWPEGEELEKTLTPIYVRPPVFVKPLPVAKEKNQ